MTTPVLSVSVGNPPDLLQSLFASFLVTTALTTHTVSADGNTLTKTTNGALTLDGVTPGVGSTFLYIPTPGSAESGFYKVVSVGGAGSQWVVTRVDGWQTGITLPAPLVRFVITRGTVSNRSFFVLGATPGAAIILGTTLCTVVSAGGSAPEATYGDSSGTPGAATLNTGSGRSAIALGASSVVITNSEVTAGSVVNGTLEDRDATGVDLVIVPAAGSFTASVAANCTAATKFRWSVTRPVTIS